MTPKGKSPGKVGDKRSKKRDGGRGCCPETGNQGDDILPGGTCHTGGRESVKIVRGWEGSHQRGRYCSKGKRLNTILGLNQGSIAEKK